MTVLANPVAVGADLTVVGTGTVKLDVPPASGGIKYNSAGAFRSTVDVRSSLLHIPDAVNGPYFALTGVPTTAATSSYGYTGLVDTPQFASGNTGPHPWQIIQQYDCVLQTAIDTSTLAQLDAGDVGTITHALKPHDVVNIKGVYAATQYPASAPQTGVSTTDFYRFVSPNNLTRLTGELTAALPADVTDVFWSVGKTVLGFTFDMCVLDKFSTPGVSPYFQIQDGVDHLVIDQSTLPGYGLSFRSDARGFGLDDVVIRNSIIWGTTSKPGVFYENNCVVGGGATGDTQSTPTSIALALASLGLDTGDLTRMDSTLYGSGSYKPGLALALQAMGDLNPVDFTGRAMSRPLVGAVQP